MKQIAILLATYNGERFLTEMLTSLENQTYKEFLCYIHDDGSTDGTGEIIQEWVSAHPDRYRVLEGAPRGSAKANFLWMLSQVDADYYMFSDQDDVWLPDKIAKSLEALSEIMPVDAQPACAFTDMYVVDRELHVISDSFIRYIDRDPKRILLPQLLVENPAAGCTQIFNRTLRDLALQLRDADRIEMHDIWVLSLAAAFGDNNIAVIDAPLVYYRQHEKNEMGAVAESKVHKVFRNITDFLTGKIWRRKKAYISQARDLAEQLSYVEGLPEEQAKFLKEFSQISGQSKWKRIQYYHKNGISKNHGTIWMYLWI